MNGEFLHNLDSKGRVIMPAKLRDELLDDFVITRGLDGCLFVYPRKEWDVLEEKIKALSLSQSRHLKRFFFSNATDCIPDSQGRVLIPQPLREYAGLTKSVTIIGVAEKAEIWDTEKYKEYNANLNEEDIILKMEEIGF